MGCCKTFKGLTLGCETGVGGIRRIWVACWDNVNGKEIVAADEMKLPTDVSAWKRYEFRKQTGSVTSTITKDDATGMIYWSSDIALQFTKQETSKRIEINAMALGDMAVIVEDNNGTCWYYGHDFPVSLSDGTAETGTALGDLNGYTITLQDLSKEMPYPLDKASTDAIQAIGAATGGA